MQLEHYSDEVVSSDGQRPQLIKMVGTVSTDPMVSNMLELAAPTPPITPNVQLTPEPIIEQAAEPQLAIEAISVTEPDQPLSLLAAEKPADIEIVIAEPGTIGALVTERILHGGKKPPTINDMATLEVALQAHQQSRFKKFGKDGVLTAFGSEENIRFSEYYDELQRTKSRLSRHLKGWNSAEIALM
jgi:hypothetical protein